MKQYFFENPHNILSRIKIILKFSFRMGILFSVFFFVIPGSAQSPPVKIYNTHGSADFKAWTIINGTTGKLVPENVVVENGLIRLTFPCNLGRKGGEPKRFDQKAGHLVYLMTGGEYKLAQDANYGDWIYAGDSVIDTLTGFKITKNTDDVVQFEMSFDNHYFKGGSVIKFDPGSKNPIKKTVTLYRGHYGYVVHVDIERDLPGEREAGFGLADKPTFYYNPDTGHQRPDNRTTYIYLRQPGEMKNFWGAGISPEKEFYRFLAVRPEYPHAIRSAQWSIGQIGAFYRWVLNGLAYEAYIAVVPYDASKAREITILGNTALVEVPLKGKYTIFSRKGQLYEPIVRNIKLRKGKNKIKLPDNAELDNAIIVPISNGKNFPEDIFTLYHDLYK